MRAMTLTEPASIDRSPLALSEVATPEPGVGEIVVRVEACGICRTDLHVVEGELPPHRKHIIPGHQIVGGVHKCGPGSARFKLDDRVGIAWLRSTCGNCKYCLAGNENLCPYAKFTGYDENGGYAEYAVVREDFAYALPTALDPVTTAPLLCAGIIGYRALRRADVRPGCRVGLFGFGSSASIVIQVARHWGCTVYVMTRDERHRSLARELGATWVGGGNDKPPELLDSAILFAPVGDLVPPALESLDRGGTLALAGIYMTDIPTLNYNRQLFYEKNLRSVTANTRQDGKELLNIAVEVPLRPKTTRFSLKDANRALQMLKHDAIQGSGVIVMSETS
jgi:propanol-preferring alcohol dehydrogenase